MVQNRKLKNRTYKFKRRNKTVNPQSNLNVLLSSIEKEGIFPSSDIESLKSQDCEKMKTSQEFKNQLLDYFSTNTLALSSGHASIQQWEGKNEMYELGIIHKE
jgi:protein involved in sex pheromone biosynthesis